MHLNFSFRNDAEITPYRHYELCDRIRIDIWKEK